MIIYGSKAKQLAKESLTEKCPHCGTQNSIDLHVFQKYAHVFWVPAFPLGKTGVSQCNHCKQTLRLKEMPPALRSAYENVKSQTKTPLWTFVGAALFAVLIASVAFSESEKAANTEKYIAHLQANDLLEVKTDEGDYTYLRVNAVKGDTVYLQSNKQAATRESGLRKLSTAQTAFYEDLFAVAQTDLINQYKKKEILNVIRQ